MFFPGKLQISPFKIAIFPVKSQVSPGKIPTSQFFPHFLVRSPWSIMRLSCSLVKSSFFSFSSLKSNNVPWQNHQSSPKSSISSVKSAFFPGNMPPFPQSKWTRLRPPGGSHWSSLAARGAAAHHHGAPGGGASMETHGESHGESHGET